jgi:hypothetical protein
LSFIVANRVLICVSERTYYPHAQFCAHVVSIVYIWCGTVDAANITHKFLCVLRSIHVGGTVLGNGRRLRFWTDMWLERCSIAQLAPDLTAAVPKQRQKTRSVESGLDQCAWIQDIQGARTLPVLMEYDIEIRQRLETVELNPDADDRMVWRWTSSGTYSSSSAYSALCLGQSSLLAGRQRTMES